MKFKNFKSKIKNYSNGQAVISATVFFLIMSLVIISSFSAVVLRETKNSQNFIFSKKSYFLAEAGVEDIIYRIIKGKNYSNQEIITIDEDVATTTITTVGNERYVTAEGNVKKDIRKVETVLSTDIGASFFYGLQAGGGGLLMENSSSVSGNVYSNGPINGANSNQVRGTVISAGASGLIDGINATGTVYAHTIRNSSVGEDAYYGTTIFNTTVAGNVFPNSPDQPIGEMPISDAKIDEWKTVAENEEIINSPCPYVINSDVVIGPVKINCDLVIQGDPTVTLLGIVWVAGNITIENTAIIRLDPLIGPMSLAIIADNPVNRTTSSKISLENSAQFLDSGTSGSYILMVSQNSSAEGGGSGIAINVQNTVAGKLLVYAGHGEILLNNSANLKEVTAYRIRLRNTAMVIYETGLSSLLFQSGPGGAYTISKWKEI